MVSFPLKITACTGVFFWAFEEEARFKPFLSGGIQSTGVEGDWLSDQWELPVKSVSTNEEAPASLPSPSEPTILSLKLYSLPLTWVGSCFDYFNFCFKIQAVNINCFPPLISFQKSHLEVWEAFCFQGSSLVCLLAGNRAILDQTFTKVATNQGSWATSETLSLTVLEANPPLGEAIVSEQLSGLSYLLNFDKSVREVNSFFW